MSLPEPAAGTGQITLSIDDTVDPCSVEGFVVGFQDAIALQKTTDGKYFLNNIPPGDRDIVITAGEIAVAGLTGGTDRTRGVRMNKVGVLAGNTTKRESIKVPVAGVIKAKVGKLGGGSLVGCEIYIPNINGWFAKTDGLGAVTLERVPVGTHPLQYGCGEGFFPGILGAVEVRSAETTDVPEVKLLVDTGASGAVLINEGDAVAHSREVDLSIAASSDATLMKIGTSATFDGIAWRPVAPSAHFTFPEVLPATKAGRGTKTVYVKFANSNALETSPYSDTIDIDLFPDSTVSMSVNNGATKSTSRDVQVATDFPANAVEMNICENPGLSGCSWIPVSHAFPYTFQHDGEHLYVRFRDASQFESENLTYDIIVDTVVPEINLTSVVENEKVIGNQTIAGTCQAGLSVAISASSGVTVPPSTTCTVPDGRTEPGYSFTLTPGVDANFDVTVSQTDVAGNESSVTRHMAMAVPTVRSAIGLKPSDLYSVGNDTYAVYDGFGLAKYDTVASIANPAQTWQFNTDKHLVMLAGDGNLMVAGYGRETESVLGVVVFDIGQSPPVELATIPLDQPPRAISLSGTNLFIAAQTKVYYANLVTPASSIVLKEHSYPNTQNNVAISSFGTGAIAVISSSSAKNPVVLEVVGGELGVVALSAANNHSDPYSAVVSTSAFTYAATGRFIDIIDNSDPTSLTVFDNGTIATDLALSDGKLLVFGQGTDHAFKVYDITAPHQDAPDILGSTVLMASGRFGSGSRFFTGQMDKQYLNFANPSAMTLVATSLWPGEHFDAGVVGTNFAVRLGDQVVAFDTSDPVVAHRKVLVSSGATHFVAKGDYLYYTESNNIHVWNIANQDNPIVRTTISRTELPSNPSFGMATIGGNVLAIGANQKLYLYGLATPETPNYLGQVGFAQSNTTTTELNVFEDTVLWNINSKLAVFDITNRASPIVKSSDTNSNGSGGALWKKGEIIYNATGSGGVTVLRSVNMGSPLQLTTISEGDSLWDVAMRGNYLFVANGQHGLSIFNVYDPYNPVEVFTLNRSVDASQIFMAGDKLFIYGRNGALEITGLPGAP